MEKNQRKAVSGNSAICWARFVAAGLVFGHLTSIVSGFVSSRCWTAMEEEERRVYRWGHVGTADCSCNFFSRWFSIALLDEFEDEFFLEKSQILIPTFNCSQEASVAIVNEEMSPMEAAILSFEGRVLINQELSSSEDASCRNKDDIMDILGELT
ncbi:hypothetical protein H5410_062605 [Solanum commersonii]|uniref:Uncharacterized protein n=1 Tax=Solanum commersonii TaxID=4109 RepID=A0A9J5WBZ1_SOLCO|nr:hypothetical protein H5410_062605 [Solanum commersonii]